MKALASIVPLSLSVLVDPVLLGCQDLSLADDFEYAGGGANGAVGGASSPPTSGSGGTRQTDSASTVLGGAVGYGGASSGLPSGGSGQQPASSGPAGGAAMGGLASSGGSNSATGGLSATGATSAAAGGIVAGGNKATTGGVFSAGGANAATGGLQSMGGSNAAIGGVSSTGGTSAAIGGVPATGGSSATTGGLSSTGGTSAANGGLTSTGGTTAATGGFPTTGGSVAASGGVQSAGGTSSLVTLASGGATSAPDGGSGVWEPCVNSQVTTLAQSPVALNNVFVGCSNGDLFVTFDALSTTPSWTKRDWSDTGGMPDQAVNSIVYSPNEVNTVYVAFAGSKQGRKLWKTVTSGVYWVELSSVTLSEIWSLSVNPLDPLKVYAFGPGGPVMSADAGSTWTTEVTPAPMNVSIAEGAKLSTVSVASGNPDVIWVGATNGDIFGTTNATTTQSWFLASRAMPQMAVTHLALDITRNPVTVFATFDGMASDSIWVTSNNGFGWSTWLNPDLPALAVGVPGVYAYLGISINPVDSNVLYINNPYGAGRSVNEGTSWSWVARH